MSIKYHDVNVGVTLGESGGVGAVEAWDFRAENPTPLIGLKRATKLTNYSVTFDAAGAVFDAASDYLLLGSLPVARYAIEVDVASMTLPILSSNHQRFIMADEDEGFIYRYTTHQWEFYGSSGWATSSGEGDPSFFNGATIRCEIDENNYWHIYRNGVLFYEPNVSSSLRSFRIGSNGNSIRSGTISALRFM